MLTSHLDNIAGDFIPNQVLVGLQPDEIDLNEVLETICNKHIVENQKNFILRYDNLPIVAGSNKNCFVHLFEPLIAMIVCHPPVNSKLFLYIKCSPEKPDVEIMDLLSETKQLYRIEFHTNITTNQLWEDLYKNKLAECLSLAMQNGGAFSFNPISNTGCLFSVCLPGKIY